MASHKTGPADPLGELEALVRESERLRQRSAEILADMDTLQRRMGQLFIDMAPLDHRPAKRRKKSRS